ncbi:MAG: hypothetical protein HS117_00595 [Verrucomicrobiaceae bacterium]|nr:hypothetical protein [Verrucomicrobiaceae bacterium]
MKPIRTRLWHLFSALLLAGAAFLHHAPLLAEGPPKGPPGKVPPDEAKGRQLAEFIKQAKARGLKGRELARAIAEERKRLGLPPEDEDEKNDR